MSLRSCGIDNLEVRELLLSMHKWSKKEIRECLWPDMVYCRQCKSSDMAAVMPLHLLGTFMSEIESEIFLKVPE